MKSFSLHASIVSLRTYFRKFLLLGFLIIASCSKDKAPATGNYITSFSLPIGGEMVDGIINQSNNSITLNVIDANLSALRPTVVFSEGATIDPLPNVVQDFNQPVRYTVTAEDGTAREYVVQVNNTILKTGNAITDFQLEVNGEQISGEINQDTQSVVFTLVGAQVTEMLPTLQISEGASVSPASGVAQDFSEPVTYTVTAENGTMRQYAVTVNNRPFNSENIITSFSIGINGESVVARVDNDSRSISFETGSFNISALAPEILISEYASISPASGETVDFTQPVIYTVTAENGEVAEYTVSINEKYQVNAFTLVGPRYGAQLLFVRAMLYIDLDFMDPTVPGASLFLDDGVNQIPLPLLETSSYENQRIISHRVSTRIPDNTPTSTNYKIVFQSGDLIAESDFLIDVLAENAPRIISVNQDSYVEGDTLIVTGENLTDFIGVPSNASFYLFNPDGNIVVSLNPEKTEYQLLMQGSFSRSAFFPFNATTRDVIFMTAERRMGDQITINVN